MPKGLYGVDRRIRRWKQKSLFPESGCWLYQGSADSQGYGHAGWEGRITLIHRISAHIFLGLDLKSSTLALHKPECPNKNCWNPDHLYLGNHVDNWRDRRHANA